jgi:amidase
MDETTLAFAGVKGQADLLRKGEVSVKELVETSLRRIERLDPGLNAFRIVYGEQALEQAKSAQRRMRSKEPPPLLGVPVAIKDNTDVAGDVTTHGTLAYGAAAEADADVVRRVKEAGAIVIGRTNVPPLCAMCVTESTAFGFTRNPWDPSRSPGGSSGGTAAAVASGMVAAGLATDGGGSIRVPAAFSGLFGLKPQRGRVSLAPFAEHWYGLSVAGWLTRSVADQALMLDVTMGPTGVDAEVPPEPARPFAKAAAAKPGELKIAYSMSVPPGVFGVRIDDEVKAGVMETVELLRGLGHEVTEHDPDYGPLTVTSTALRVIKGAADEAKTLPHFDRLERRFKHWTRLGSLISDAGVAWARRTGEDARNRLAASTFERFDVLITPVASEPAIEVGRWEGRGAIWTLNGMIAVIPWPGIWNSTGQPAASVPAGFTAGGLPRAAMLVGRPNDEDTLISLAAQLESERDWLSSRPPVS